MSDFGFFGPIEFDTRILSTDKKESLKAKKCFWEVSEKQIDKLRNAVGIYVFVIQHGTSWKPWYVGKTCSEKGFEGEIFQPHKIKVYTKLQQKSGAYRFFFMPLLTKSGRISKNTSTAKKEIEWLERRIISIASLRNPDLENVRDTKLQSKLFVPGVVGTRRVGRPQYDAKMARSVFFGEPFPDD